MGNLYSLTTNQAAIRQLFDGIEDRAGNVPPLPGIFPDTMAPIVRNGADGLELVMGRWGMPSPQGVLRGKKADPGVTQYPQYQVVPLAALDGAGAPLPRAVHVVLRVREDPGRHEAGVVRRD